MRAPNTWEEAHEVIVELENIKAGTRAFSHAARGGGQTGLLDHLAAPQKATKKEKAAEKRAQVAEKKAVRDVKQAAQQ